MSHKQQTGTSMQVRIPAETYEKIRKVAAEQRRTIHNTIVIALEDSFEAVELEEEKAA